MILYMIPGQGKPVPVLFLCTTHRLLAKGEKGMRKKEYQNTGKSIPFAIGVGTGISLVVMMLGILITALLLMNETIKESAIGYGVMIITIVSAIAGCATTVTLARNRILVLSICTAFVFALLLLAITALFFGGQYNGVWVTMLMIIGSSVAVALVAGKHLNRPKAYRKKK